jgi:hypothetical protein
MMNWITVYSVMMSMDFFNVLVVFTIYEFFSILLIQSERTSHAEGQV